MVNELCELAASGVNATQIGIVGVVLIVLGILCFVLNKKRVLRARWLLPVLLFLFTIGAPVQHTAFAQDANNDCVSEQDDGQNPGTPEAIGGLVDDNPDLVYDEDFGEFYATFAVLPNDNAPDGDGFDIATLQLLGDYPHPEYPHTFLILDPENPVPPETPNFPGNPDWGNVWGQWYLELTCDPDDTDHCGIDPDDTIVCYDPSAGTCWPTGNASVYFNNLAQPGVYSIQYTVNTESGIPLIPATITVNLPEPPPPSPITAASDTFFSGSCGEWPTGDFSVDLMDYVSTTGSGALLPGTIDLDPMTPEVDSSVTVYNANFPSNYITFVVDENGIVTMTAPMGGTPGTSDDYSFEFTIRDTDDFESNTGSITVSFDCA